jgi:beta-galactosidase/beta-glucuronidase
MRHLLIATAIGIVVLCVTGAAGVAGVSPVPPAAAQTSDTSGWASATLTYTIFLPIVKYASNWLPKTPPLSTRWTGQVTVDNALPEYPRPQLVRADWQNLNGPWEFASGSAYAAPPFNTHLPETILVPFPMESALSGIMRHEESMWYRRTFYVPSTWSGRHILLNFDAVDWEATVYVNGRYVGTHRGGYDAFSFNVTGWLVDGPNELIVRVFDPTDNGSAPIGKQHIQPRVIWYTSVSGIWQTVWLEPVPEAHITQLRLTPDIDRQQLQVVVYDAGATTETVEVIASAGGTPIGTATGALGSELSVPIPNPHLWSPDDPFLYDLQIRLENGSAIGDQVTSYFGMRKVEVVQTGSFYRIHLNGRFVPEAGILDQGYWPDGLYTAPTDEALRFDVEQAKALGFNLIRKHVKVEPARWYYWTDKLGMLVWQDMPSLRDGLKPDEAAKAQFELELREMIAEHYNAPSIVMWILFNEYWGQHDLLRLTPLAKSLDPSRLLNAASGSNNLGIGDILDAHNYVQAAAPKAYKGPAAVAGEYGGLGLVVEGHRWGTRMYAPEWEADVPALSGRFYALALRVADRVKYGGLSGSVYTQIVDVENELNGLLTYDRAVLKPDTYLIRLGNQAILDAANQIDWGAAR